jgi:hypothetical protein
MGVFIDYEGSRYELAADVDPKAAFSQIVDCLNHSWRRQQNKTLRPDDSTFGYIAEDYDPWVHFPLAGGGKLSFHVHDTMHMVFGAT